MTLLELEQKLKEARKHGATDDSSIQSGVNHDLQIDISEENGYEREYSIEI